jgi:hypothetical protein
MAHCRVAVTNGALQARFCSCSRASLRRQSEHRQAAPSSGTGSRTVSCAHQHGPAGLQLNAAPQAEQLTSGEEGISFQFVMQSRVNPPRF